MYIWILKEWLSSIGYPVVYIIKQDGTYLGDTSRNLAFPISGNMGYQLSGFEAVTTDNHFIKH